MQFSEIIRSGQQRIASYHGYDRDFSSIEPLWELHKIISILGGRRVGKTYSLFQLMKEAIEKKYCKLDDIIFVDFAEGEQRGLDLLGLHEFVINQGIQHPVYCLDEIQEVKDFDRQLIVLYNLGVKIFITGSNSKLLSQDIATILRGRTYELHQDILSFPEFLRFKGYTQEPNDIILDGLLEEYLTRGGYPEVVLSSHEEIKLGILKGYYELLLYKDLIDRYHIRNHSLLQQLLKSLILSHTKELNINKLYQSYHSQGFEISKNTVYEYLGYIKQTFFVSTLSQFYRKNLFDKRYCIDNGYMQLFSKEQNRGQKFESMIFKYLKKHHHHLGFVKENYEIDFTDGESNRQVCWELTDENWQRESMFAQSQLMNTLITRSSHRYVHDNIHMKTWKDIVL